MQNSKLIVLLKTFDETILAELHKFVSSPFRNEQKNVISLYQTLYKLAPTYKKPNIEKEYIWKHIYPKETYNDIRLRRLMTDLLRVCEDFIIYKQAEKDKLTQQTYLLQYYRANELDKHFNTCLRNIRNHQAQYPQQDIWHYNKEFTIEREISMHIGKQRNRTIDPNLQVLSNKLDAYFLVNKLKCCCYIVSYQNIRKGEYNLPMLDAILAHLNEHDYSAAPMIVFYKYALLVLLEPDNRTYFEQLKATLLDNLPLFAQEEIEEMFLTLRNYCIKRANKGDQKYLNELFEVYKIEIAHNILSPNNELSPFTYKNMVTLGMKLQKYDWTKTFIEENKTHLAQDFQESSYAFNLARLYFDTGNFENIIPLLNQMEYKEIFIELSSKTLLMKTYFELEEFEALHSFLDSFQMFIRRKKKTLGYHWNSYMNLIKATRQLVRLQYNNNKNIEKVIANIQNEKAIVDKKWLLDKLALFV